MKKKSNLPPYIKNSPKANGKPNPKPYWGWFTYKNTLYNCGLHKTVREAQIAVDRKRLELGLEPVLLKKVSVS